MDRQPRKGNVRFLFDRLRSRVTDSCASCYRVSLKRGNIGSRDESLKTVPNGVTVPNAQPRASGSLTTSTMRTLNLANLTSCDRSLLHPLLLPFRHPLSPARFTLPSSLLGCTYFASIPSPCLYPLLRPSSSVFRFASTVLSDPEFKPRFLRKKTSLLSPSLQIVYRNSLDIPCSEFRGFRSTISRKTLVERMI